MLSASFMVLQLCPFAYAFAYREGFSTNVMQCFAIHSPIPASPFMLHDLISVKPVVIAQRCAALPSSRVERSQNRSMPEYESLQMEISIFF